MYNMESFINILTKSKAIEVNEKTRTLKGRTILSSTLTPYPMRFDLTETEQRSHRNYVSSTAQEGTMVPFIGWKHELFVCDES